MYEGIIEFIKYLQGNYGLNISFKDYCGFIAKDEQLDNMLRPYLAHTSPYCLFIKGNNNDYLKCLMQKKPLYEKCKCGETFFGCCHAGVGEMVVPIMKSGTVIGSINVANYVNEPEKAKDKMKKALSKFPTEKQVVGEKLYQEFMKDSNIDAILLIHSLEILAKYLSEIARIEVNASDSIVYSNLGIEKSNIEKIDKYIKNNFKEKIKITDLAKECGLSSKKVLEEIKSHHNMILADYLNFIRVTESKKLLLENNISIKDVSVEVGFANEKLYKEKFEEIFKITPNDYIKYYKNETMF